MIIDPLEHPNCYLGDQYAKDIVSGKIAASKFTIGACKRYLDDLNRTDEFTFDIEYAEKYLRLVQKFEHVIGNWPTKNIVYQPWQNFVWMNIMGWKSIETGYRRFRIAHVEVARGNAKALCLETDIPTPDRGLVKFGSLKIGDRVYSSTGEICNIIGKNDIHFPKSYRMHFSDGTKIDCSDKHLWNTSSKNERRRKASSVKDTEEIFKTLRAGKEANHSIETCGPIVGSREDCQLGYVLGYWLGDGHSSHGKFTAHEDQFDEICKRFKSRKLEVRITEKKGKAIVFLVPGLTYWLKEMGVLKNKHIPEKYFMAGEDVRRELLRGLMDSDGTISKQIGNFTFCNVNKNLATGTRRLIASLGYKAHLRKSVSKCQNGYVGSAHYVTFSTPNTRPTIFGIRAKEDRRCTRPIHCLNKRYINHVEEIDPKPMFCIEVDSKDKTFLITDQYIPTHNSAMASQAALFFLALDNPQGNQIATVASRRDQARIVLDSARHMAKKAVSFRTQTGVKVQAHSITHDESNSKIRALSSDSTGLDGLNDILAVCDELHAMSREVFEVIYSGMSKRRDSLTLCITTAGFDIDSVGYSQSSYAKKVALGDVKDDQFFAIVYTLDEDDDIFDPEVWIKANPGYGDSVDPHTFEAKVAKAKEMPSDIPNLKVKHLNLWLSEANAFFDLVAWDKCADTSLKIEDFAGEKTIIGVDLASKIDLTSLGYIFERGGIYYLFDKSYIPEDRVKKIRNTLYDECIARGHLIQTKGEAIHYPQIEKEILESSKIFRIQEILYDPWSATGFAQNLAAERLNLVEFKQNTSNLSEPTKTMDALIRQGKIRHNGSPLLRWAFANIVCKYDAADNVFPRKTHERLKIDPAIALIMSLASWTQKEKKVSVYESRGIKSIQGK